MKISCCKDCNARQVGCHASCPLYAEERAKADEAMAARAIRRAGAYGCRDMWNNNELYRRSMKDRK